MLAITGEGTAFVDAQKVVMILKGGPAGDRKYSLSISGDYLSGTTEFFSIVLPISLSRMR